MDAVGRDDRANVFAIALLAKRLADVIAWKQENHILGPLPVGLFGAITGLGRRWLRRPRFPKAFAPP
jgi:hypothetical protein